MIIERREKPDHIFIQFDGKLNWESLTEIIRAAKAEAEKYRCNRFLADIRNAVITESFFGIYNFGEKLRTFGLEPSDIIAVITSDKNKKHHFFHMIVSRMGWNNIRYFPDTESGIGWLAATP